MTLAFLVPANLVLTARLVILFKDGTTGGAAWAGKALFELACLAALFRFSGVTVAAAAVLLAANVAGWWWEKRSSRKDLGRLALGLLTLTVLSICAAPAFGWSFRPALAGASARLADWTVLAPLATGVSGRSFQLALLGLLLAANEANLLIRAAFDWLNLKPQMRAATPGTMEVDFGEYNRGRIIGLLERALIYFFVLNGQFGVIGFALAAKAFTRFKELDDRRFAEYVLIGTLLSASLAVVTAAVVKWLLRP
ncbi:MAG TPA: hypothetical protein VL200_17175 [Lacunisphaera sp.]|nr:hypothetical protein [Lacunisphaera sp.]